MKKCGLTEFCGRPCNRNGPAMLFENRGSNYQLIANLQFQQMKKVLFLISCVWVISPVFAQLNNTAFYDRLKVTPEDSGRLYLDINTQVPQSKTHRHWETDDQNFHEVEYQKGSLL